MTTNPNKPAICYGLFRVRGIPDLVEEGHKLERSAYIMMKVTSFSKNHSGTRMAHGQDMQVGKSAHRKADGMFFYESEEAMRSAVLKADKVEIGLIKQVREAMAASAEAQRHYRVVMEQHLGKRAVQPLELEVL